MSEYGSAAISRSKSIINQDIFNMPQELEIKPEISIQSEVVKYEHEKSQGV